MPANRHRILLHRGESRSKKMRQPRCKAGRLPSSDPEINDLFFISYFDVSWSQHHSLLSARHRSMSSFIYVLVFVTCSTVYHGCLTTTSNQTFASRQECLEAAGLIVGIQSATCKPRRVFVQ